MDFATALGIAMLLNYLGKKKLIAFGISLVATLVVMPLLIPFLHKIKFGQSIRKEGPQSHMAKTGTPTMGGLVFVGA